MLVKTENGQFHLIRVQPGTGVGAGAVTANSLAGNVIATQGGTIRLLPGVSRLNAQFTGPPLATIRKPVQVKHTKTYSKTRSRNFVVVFMLNMF